MKLVHGHNTILFIGDVRMEEYEYPCVGGCDLLYTQFCLVLELARHIMVACILHPFDLHKSPSQRAGALSCSDTVNYE